MKDICLGKKWMLREESLKMNKRSLEKNRMTIRDSWKVLKQANYSGENQSQVKHSDIQTPNLS